MISRPVKPRARWTASIVDSVPEFVKRHWGSPQRRRREVRALVHARLDGGADDGVGVPDAHDAEAVVEVEVLVAVDVPDLCARAALDVDGPRVVLLELAGHAARHDAGGPLEVLARAGGPLSVDRPHPLREGGHAVAVDRGGGGGGGAHAGDTTRASPLDGCGYPPTPARSGASAISAPTMAAAALEPAATALATDGICSAASPAASSPGALVRCIASMSIESAATGPGSRRSAPRSAASGDRWCVVTGTSRAPTARSVPSAKPMPVSEPPGPRSSATR